MTVVARSVCCLGLLTVLIAGGCASPREYRYSLEVAVRDALPANPPARSVVVVGPISVPELVDRPQLVVRDGSYDVTLLEQQRWATPLKESLPRVLAADLGERLPTVRFVPQSSFSGAGPDGRLQLDFLRIDILRNSGAVMLAHWSYRPVAAKDGTAAAVIEGDLEARAALTEAGYPGYVDALRRASATLAASLATELASRLAPQ